MKTEQNENILEQYLGFGIKQISIFILLVVVVVVGVTIAYTSIFGFKTWENNMSQAGSLLLSNAEVPLTPGMNNPVGGTTLQPLAPVAATPPCSQFMCPSCGVIGLPGWNGIDSPICPSCGALMGALTDPANTQLAAAT